MLKEYVQRGQPERCQDAGASGSKSLDKQPITSVIHMITGATEEWAQSRSKKKTTSEKHNDVRRIVQEDSRRQKLANKVFPLNTDIVQDNGNDSIVVSAIINTFLVERILIDDSSAVKVLMWKAF